MKIYTAMVCTPEYGGLSIILSTTSEHNAYKALANWCKEYASDADLDEDKLAKMSNKRVIAEYFSSESIIEKGEMGAVEESELEE